MQKHPFGNTRQRARKTLWTLACAVAFGAAAQAQADEQQNLGGDRVAYVGGTVVSPHLPAPIADAVVLVKDGRIEAVGPASLAIGEGYRRVNIAGRYLAPGYIDAHMHFFQSGGAFTRPDSFDFSQIQPYATDRAWVEAHLEDTSVRYLMSGITAVADMCGPSLNYRARALAASASFAPTVATAGACISSFGAPALDLGDGDPVYQHVTSAEAAVAAVRDQLKRQPDLIKIVWSPDGGESPQQLFDLFEHAIRLARHKGIPVAVHATDLANAKMAIRAGANILVHGVMTDAIDEEFITLAKQHDIIYVPTIAVHQKMTEMARGEPAFSDHEHALAHADILASFEQAAAAPGKAGMMVQMVRKYMAFVDADDTTIAALSPQEQAIVGQLKGFFAGELVQIQRQNLKRLYDEGVTLAVGTDAGNPGVLHGASFLTEMAEWQKAGLPQQAILRAATLNGAKVIGLGASLGSIEAGKRADMVVLTRNPLEAVENMAMVEAVVKGGTYRRMPDLQDQLTDPR